MQEWAKLTLMQNKTNKTVVAMFYGASQKEGCTCNTTYKCKSKCQWSEGRELHARLVTTLRDYPY